MFEQTFNKTNVLDDDDNNDIEGLSLFLLLENESKDINTKCKLDRASFTFDVRAQFKL